jgi:uncharacterized membrane protein YdjX (TVP38/TMEM64 family)
VNARNLQRGLAAAAVLAGLSAFYWLHFRANVEWRPDSLRDFVAGLGALGPIVFIAIMAFRPFLGLPSWLVLLAAGLVFGPWLGMLYGALGGVLGAGLIFGVARAFGREAVQARIGGGLRVFDEFLAERGASFVALYTMVPIAPVLPVFASAGVSRMRLVPFCLAAGAGYLPRAGLYTFGGQVVAEPTGANFALMLALLAAGIAITVFARRTLFKGGPSQSGPPA